VEIVLATRKDIPYLVTVQRRDSMIVSKLTTKSQTTIPQPVRSALGVREGDELAYVIEDGRVILTKAPARRIRHSDPLEDPFATFWEWSSQEDAEDFAGL
jgi:antitoxin PrlF